MRIVRGQRGQAGGRHPRPIRELALVDRIRRHRWGQTCRRRRRRRRRPRPSRRRRRRRRRGKLAAPPTRALFLLLKPRPSARLGDERVDAALLTGTPARPPPAGSPRARPRCLSGAGRGLDGSSRGLLVLLPGDPVCPSKASARREPDPGRDPRPRERRTVAALAASLLLEARRAGTPEGAGSTRSSLLPDGGVRFEEEKRGWVRERVAGRGLTSPNMAVRFLLPPVPLGACRERPANHLFLRNPSRQRNNRLGCGSG